MIIDRATVAKRKAVAAAVGILFACIVHSQPLGAQDFPPAGWARLADSMSQRLECLKIAGKSMAQGMQCKLTQARALPPLDLKHREWFGEFYSPGKYRKCLEEVGSPTSTGGCEYLRLMREPEPEFWPYPDAPRPKWPEAPNPPTYRKSMTSNEYFAALCKREAGEFVYRVVEGVEGIYQVRPRKRAWDNALEDRFVLEDPYGYTRWESRDPETIFVRGEFATYAFFESTPRAKLRPEFRPERFDKSVFLVPPPSAVVERYFGYDGKEPSSLRKEYDTKPRSRYGYIWRGIQRPSDRRLAIAGGELMVFDLHTGEVLGIRRGFAMSGFARNARSGIQWETASVCPRLRRQPDGWDKSGNFMYWFVSKVLQPKQ